jgi:hypothetical protein
MEGRPRLIWLSRLGLHSRSLAGIRLDFTQQQSHHDPPAIANAFLLIFHSSPLLRILD